MKSWRKIWAIVWKDLLSEMRTKETISSVLVFTLLVIVVFNFAFGSSPVLMKQIAPGVLWVTFTFAGVLSLNRAFIIEKEDASFEGLMACPVSRDIIYFGKAISSLIFMLIVEVIALPVFAFLFNLPVLSLAVATITLLSTIGFVAVGTLFSAMAVNTKARELVLPILFLPVVSPVVISAVRGSGLAISGEPWSSLTSWFEIIVAFDAIFVIASFLVFSYVIEE